MAITVESKAFTNGSRIPRRHTCDGEDVSPEISWSKVNCAASYAVIVEDPDAPMGTFVHWVIFNIHDAFLQEGIRPDDGKYVQGMNDFGKIGYGGPCPPRGHGQHRYFFRVYALTSDLKLKRGATANQVREAMKGMLLDSGELMGVYSR